MKVEVKVSNDWSAVDAAVIDTLNRRGFSVAIIYGYLHADWSVEVPEWRDYLSAVWHVYADISRGSEGVWPLRCKRTVEVNVDGHKYSVKYWVSPNGIQYGSVA